MSTKPANTVATTPFLTVDQVASELNIHANAVRRLIALRALGAFRTPAENGEWKITPEALAAYVASGSPRSAIPFINRECDNYDDGNLRQFATMFETDVQAKLAELLTEECPVKGTVSGNSYTVPLTTEVASQISSLAALPARWWERMPREKKSHYPDRATQFLGSWLLTNTLVAASPTMTERVNQLMTPWAKLYDSPESYRKFVDGAWEAVQQRKIFVARGYPSESVDGGHCRVYVEFRYALFGVQLADLEPLVF